MTQKLQKEVEDTSERMIEFELEREQMMQENMKVHLTAIKQNSLSFEEKQDLSCEIEKTEDKLFSLIKPRK